MKSKIVFIILCIIFLSGCSIENHFPGLYFRNKEEVFFYVINNIKYITDSEKHGKEEYWQKPWNTLEDKSGDCEDICILILWLWYENFGIKGNMIINKNTKSLHASVEYQGKEYYTDENQVFFIKLDYDTVMFLCDLFN